MVRKAHIYTIRCLKQTFRNWEAYIQIFIIPVVLLLSFAWLYGEGSGYDVGHEHGDHFKVGVINQDNFTSLAEVIPLFNSHIKVKDSDLIGNPLEEGFGKFFIDNINGSKNLLPSNDSRRMSILNVDNIEEAATAVQNRFLSLCFVIPNNFTQTLLAGINHKINITEGYTVSNSVKLKLSEARVELIGDMSYFRFTEAMNLLEEQLRYFMFLFSGLELESKVDLEHIKITTDNFTEFHTFIPAFFVMTLLMSSAGITYILAFERDRGTIDRLKLSNFPKDDLVLGLTLTQFITTALQIIIFFLTVYFLGFPGRLNLFLAVFVALLSIVPVLAIGIISSVQLKGEIAFFLPGMLSLPLSFLTGSFIPLPKITLIGEIQVWHLNPFYSSSEALRKILFLNYDLIQITFELLLLMGISLPMFILSVLLFKKKIYLT